MYSYHNLFGAFYNNYNGKIKWKRQNFNSQRSELFLVGQLILLLDYFANSTVHLVYSIVLGQTESTFIGDIDNTSFCSGMLASSASYLKRIFNQRGEICLIETKIYTSYLKIVFFRYFIESFFLCQEKRDFNENRSSYGCTQIRWTECEKT